MTAEKILAVSFLPSQKACRYLTRMAHRFLIVLLFRVFLDIKVPVNPPLGCLDSPRAEYFSKYIDNIFNCLLLLSSAVLYIKQFGDFPDCSLPPTDTYFLSSRFPGQSQFLMPDLIRCMFLWQRVFAH